MHQSPYSVDEMIRMSNAHVGAGHFKDVRTTAKTFSKILSGRETGGMNGRTSPARKLNEHDTALLGEVYAYLGLNRQSRDFEVHCQAMSAVCDALCIEPIARWSRLTVAQIEEYLAKYVYRRMAA